MKDNFLFPHKSELLKIKVQDIDCDNPDLKNSEESKSIIIGKWLASWIDMALNKHQIEINNLLPTKAELAYRLGVSIGTIQNSLRYLEDIGYVEAKQCIGTLIRDRNKDSKSIRKLTSKKDLAIQSIKNYLLTDGFDIGAQLPTVNTIATIINYSFNTTKIALNYLVITGILGVKHINIKEKAYYIKSLDFEISQSGLSKGVETLADMVENDILDYIKSNCKIGDKIPPHDFFAKTFKASIKTVHDALDKIAKKGFILPKRGRYGTTVIKLPYSDNSSSKLQDKIFEPAQKVAFYHYEKICERIKKMIANDYEVGDKLPSIKELTQQLDISPNTIRKAFSNLAKDGYIVFSRGRYGGTFVIDIPEVEEQSFKWLAVNPSYAKEYSNKNN